DFGIQSSVIVSADDKPRVTVFKNKILAAEAGRKAIEQNTDLIAEARALYMQHRRPKDGGFAILQHPIRSDKPIYVSDVRPVEGQISVVVAQAIVPDDELTLPDGHPQVLLTYKPLTRSVISGIAIKLGLEGLKIEPRSQAPLPGEASLDLSKSGYHAVWKASAPSETIWHSALPWIGLLLLLISAALLLVSTRYGSSVKALQRSEEQNRFLALHDALTGLPNRLQFERALEDIVEAGAQDRCAILCMDLDKFKAVNDTYGHQAGDTVIVTAANRIAACVGDAGMAARVGGDEFIVLLRDRLDHQNVLRLCDDLIRSVCQDIPFDGGTAQIGASIGVAWWPDDAKTASNIIRSADEALYRAKENGRGRAYLASDKDAAAAEDPIAA
ncbi:MAG: GGDEF domain-containing protein, partial [Pseudomonadota bacterium]